MKRRIGILTSGGDCPGLNAAIRGVAKAAYELFDTEIIGFADGYKGLIEGEYRTMEKHEFSGILTVGGTILGTSRQPYKLMRVVSDDNVDKVAEMKKNYNKLKLDCLVTLGGNGTHKTAQLLSSEGLNVVGLPKTIDNDIFGTEVTFGFHTAVDIATDVVDRIHTTATSHGRVMVIELMGNKAGWLTLYAGVAGGADIIILPEIPYSIEKVCQAVEKRRKQGKDFSIVTIAEGALSTEEAALPKKELKLALEARTVPVSYRVAAELQKATGAETRVVVPGHIQRGGSPSAYDRVLATKFGAFAAELIKNEQYGTTVAVVGNHIEANKLVDIAGKAKLVPADHELVKVAKNIGIKFGD
jgi:ATP-dependent phosphofructokinase / diphosphate-dependent phosphofructokinase